MAWACGAKVREEKLERVMPKSPSKFIKFNLYGGYSHVSIGFGGKFSLDKLSKTSAVGDPTKASTEKGEKIVSVIVDRLAEFLRELKTLEI